ncbi:cytochrome P450 [Amycolatopsis taiwanensis]|uniref:cytochrome P450 n=1 Tax=Amycolatopsis taiwanensis TaxID=342230 RepID=UPI0005C1F1EB|nr:cytochrome P450 [Amycolatopsis taiwanensis]
MRANRRETLTVLASVLGPTVAGGVIKRRPRVMGVLGAMRADRRAVRVMQELRARRGDTPLQLAVPGRSLTLVLSPEDVGRVLADSPSEFTPANWEKTTALSQFQPHGVLISSGASRTSRRDFTERVLETAEPAHQLTSVIKAKIHEETALLPETLDWPTFAPVWWRIVRRITLGDGARDDELTTDLLGRLRLAANWAFLHPRRPGSRAEFRRRLGTHLERAEEDSLAGMIARTGPSGDIDAASQVAHWLFAFDAAGMTAFRTLALLATHSGAHRQAAGASGPELPYLRASVLDTVRLWPTTPIILRDTTKDLEWNGTRLTAGTGLLIFTPFFHRDDENLPYAHSFTPEIWLDGRAKENPALVPFSGGPGECPGRNLVLLTTSILLADLLGYHLTSREPLGPNRPLPSTLDNFGLTFAR